MGPKSTKSMHLSLSRCLSEAFASRITRFRGLASTANSGRSYDIAGRRGDVPMHTHNRKVEDNHLLDWLFLTKPLPGQTRHASEKGEPSQPSLQL